MPSLRAERDGPTVVSAGMHISGNLISDCDVQIDGCVEGDVQSPRLVITEQGSVLGSVYAADVDIRGAVNGHVRAHSVTLRRSARVALDITYGKVSVETGAQLEGRLMPVGPGDPLLEGPVLRPPSAPAADLAAAGEAEFAPPPRRPASAGAERPRSALERSAVSWPPADPHAVEIQGSAPKVALGPEHLPEAILAPDFEVDAEPDARPAERGPPHAAQASSAAPRPQDRPVEAGRGMSGRETPGGPSPRRDVRAAPPAAAAGGPGAHAPSRRERREETFIGLEAEAEAALEREPEAPRFSWSAAPPPDEGPADVFEARPADILAAAHSRTVAVPITLQARVIPPRRQYGMTFAAAALIVVAAAGAYLGARALEDETLSAVAPASEQDAPAGVAPVADEVDARIQAQIEMRRRELERAGVLPAEPPETSAAAGAGTPAAGDTAAAPSPERAEAAKPGALAAVQPAAGAGEAAAQSAARTPAESEQEPPAGSAAPAGRERETAGAAAPADAGAPAESGAEGDAAAGGDVAAAKPEMRPAGSAIEDFNAGMEAAERDDFEQAVALLSPAIESGRLATASLAAAYRNRARAYAGKGQYDEALADYTRTIELMHGDAVAYNNRGYVYNKMDRPQDALPDITRAIELDPDYSYAYSNRCWTHRMLGQRDKAIADCRQALALNPGLDFARSALKRLGVAP